MNLTVCPRCRVRVAEMPDGSCPSCRQPIVGGGDSENEFLALQNADFVVGSTSEVFTAGRSGQNSEVNPKIAIGKSGSRKFRNWSAFLTCVIIALYLGLFTRFDFSMTASTGVYRIRFPDRESMLATVKADPQVSISSHVTTKLDSIDSGIQNVLQTSERRFEVEVIVTRRLTPWEWLWANNNAIPMSCVNFFDGLERAIDKAMGTTGTRVREIVKHRDESSYIPLKATVDAGSITDSLGPRLDAADVAKLRTELMDQNARCPEPVSSRVTVIAVKLEADDLVVMDHSIQLDPIVEDDQFSTVVSGIEQIQKAAFGQDANYRRLLNAGIRFRYRYFTATGKHMGEYVLTAANIDQTKEGDSYPSQQSEQSSADSIWQDWIQRFTVPAN